MTTEDIEFGLDTPVYVTVDESGRPLDGDVVIRNTIEEAVLADAVGIDSFNIGEHYRPEMMDSAGHVMLAAIAGRTERIRLGTAVTVLSTQDPVRVYTEFATLDALSNGRAQLIVGRGSLTEAFPLFGFDPLRGETRPTHPPAPGPARDLVRHCSTAAHRAVPESCSPRGAPPHMGWCWRKPAVGGPGRPLRAAADAGHYRRAADPIRSPHRALQTRAPRVRAPAAADRDALTRLRGQDGRRSG